MAKRSYHHETSSSSHSLKTITARSLFTHAFIVLFLTTRSDGFPVSRTRPLLPVKTGGRLIQSIWPNGHRHHIKLQLSSSESNTVNVTEIEEEIQQAQEAISQQIEQEKEELHEAVKEVQEAVVGVTQSAKNLGGTVINNGPGIFAKFFKLWVSEEMR